MNTLVIISGVFALMTTIGHFSMGSKSFLGPMLDATFDPVARKVMHCVFHYVSTFLILSTLAMLGVGTGVIAADGASLLVQFIAANYAAFALWQLVLASTSGIEKGVIKLFQWIFFVLIAAFAWIGAAGL
ncbi:MAG: hypothetical protein V1800_18080 [Candidatus Latescibacterota bacterium]